MNLKIYPEYEHQYNREIFYNYKVIDPTGVTYFEGNYSECLNYIVSKNNCKK